VERPSGTRTTAHFGPRFDSTTRSGISGSGLSWHCERVSSEQRPPQAPDTPYSNRRVRLPKRSVRIAVYLALSVLTLTVNYWAAHKATEVQRIRVPYSPFFLAQVQDGNVVQITSKGTAIQGVFKRETRAPAGGAFATRFATEIPAFADTAGLSRLLEKKSVVVNAVALDTGGPWWQNLLLGFGPTILLLLLLFWLLRRSRGSMLGGFGRSKARRYMPGGRAVTFTDVAGIDEAKQELTEIVDFLRNPEKFSRLGGRIPRGVLLSGPPGTGKTLLARAVAGEAGAPFFSMSASEFVEAIVGVGASRVRDLFKQAKDAAPAIIFIDELDAIGRSRSAGGSFGGGTDEREQTLNQILTEMDGFDSSTHVIVLGATNRPDVLDKALLRPGRFDRRVAVQPPDRNGRRLILEVHTRSVPLAADVDLDLLASTTPGMVGADLANLVNEAALLAARRGREAVASPDFSDSLEKIVLGAERQIMMSDADRRRTAYHEAGHALVGMLTIGADPVRKVSIIPRGVALGVTFASPDSDRFNYSKDDLVARIKVALGGRAAEEVAFGDITTGAENDIEQITRVARYMVGRWGMSDKIGLVAVLPDGDHASFNSESFSPRIRELVDDEVLRIVGDAHDEVLALLRSERERLDALAEMLLEKETLDEVDAYAAAGVPRPRKPVSTA
jgi:cell division protease FtsH